MEHGQLSRRHPDATAAEAVNSDSHQLGSANKYPVDNDNEQLTSRPPQSLPYQFRDQQLAPFKVEPRLSWVAVGGHHMTSISNPNGPNPLNSFRVHHGYWSHCGVTVMGHVGVGTVLGLCTLT